MFSAPVCLGPAVFGRPGFLGVFHPLQLVQSSSLLCLQGALSPQGRGLVETTLLGLSLPGLSLHITFVLVLLGAGGSFPEGG